jgi:hypothetical protein
MFVKEDFLELICPRESGPGFEQMNGGILFQMGNPSNPQPL